jgi:LuxR family maltose regulon positive regulatory protein
MPKVPINWNSHYKVRIPHYQIDLVRRERLLERIDDQINKPLLLIVAPAGFGKTCLVSQWLDETKRVHFKAWVNLDPDDADPQQLLAYLLMAVKEAGVELGELAQVIGLGFIEAPIKLVISALGDTLSEQEPGVLFLDDYHLVENDALNQVVWQLIQALPEHWQVVIASRVKPDLPVSSLRLHGLVAELDDKDLIFDRDEVSAFFQDAVNDSRITELLEKTAGWPAALQLAKLHEQGRGQSDYLSNDQLDHSVIADYLSEQILSDVSAEEYDFLLETSFLESFSVSLADCIRSRNDGRYLLDRLLRLKPLLIKSGGRHPQFRYQQVFRNFLEMECIQKYSDEALYRFRIKAAKWYRNEGELLPAIKLLCSVKEYQKAEEFLQDAGGWTALSTIGEGVMRNVLQCFPPDYESITVKSCRVTLLVKAGQLQQAREELKAVRTLAESQPYVNSAGQLALEFVVDLYQDTMLNPKKVKELQAYASAPNKQPDELLVVIFTGAVASHLHIGDIDGAIVELNNALDTLGENAPYARIYFYYYLGLCDWYRMDWEQSENNYQRGIQLAEEGYGPLSGVASAGKVMVADLYYYTNRSALCEATLHPYLELVSARDGWHYPYLYGYEAEVRSNYDSKGYAQAVQALEKGMEVACTRDLIRFQLYLLLLRTELMIKEGDAPGALEYLTKTVNPQLPDNWRDCSFWWQVNHQYDRLRLQCLWQRERGSTFARHLNRWETRNIPLFNAEKDLWKAGYEFSKGNTESATNNLLPLLDWIHRANAQQWVASTGAPVLPLLEYLKEAMPEHVEKITKLMTYSGQSPQSEDAKPSLLSEREHQILVMLREGLPNKTIASRLETSENTVKFHLKNLFRKLGVNKRIAAVEAARKLGIVSP